MSYSATDRQKNSETTVVCLSSKVTDFDRWLEKEGFNVVRPQRRSDARKTGAGNRSEQLTARRLRDFGGKA